MGVIFLYTFITEDVPNGVVDVNIEQEIMEYIRKTDKSPVIVIDLFSVMGLVSKKYDKLHENGRYKMGIRTKQCEYIYKRLIVAGAKLVFFTDSTVLDHKFETWSARRNREFDTIRESLDAKYEGTGDFNSNLDFLILQANWEIVASQYGELHHSIDNECDLELAAYATKNNVFAVFANDTDYLVYEGQWRYWSTQDIDDVTFVTKEYNKIALLKHLNLTEKQMPLLASLNGNDIIKKDRLYRFHKEINPVHTNRFYALAKFIQSYPAEMTRDMITEVALKALPENKGTVLKDFATSLDSYNIDKLNDGCNNELLELMKQEELFANYKILSGHADIVITLFIDLDIFDYNELVLPIIRRKFGILFQHKNDPKHRCLIYVRKFFTNHVEVRHAVVKFEILPEYPNSTVPPLTVLFSENSESLELIRWKMIHWCLSLNMNDFEIEKKVKQEFLISYFCVKFLKDQNCIREFEEKAILLTIIAIKTKGFASIEDDYPDPIIPRVIQLTFLFQSFFLKIRGCFEACGFKIAKLDQLLQFDGVLFHLFYSKLDAETFEVRNTIYEDSNISYLYDD